MGLCFYNIAFVFLYDKIYPEKSSFSGIVEIISTLEEKETLNKYEVKVKKANILNKTRYNFNLKTENTKLIIYCNKNYILYPGDIVNISGVFEKANTSRNYKGFNYRNYLKSKKIYGIVDVKELSIIDKKIDFITIIEKIRLKFENKIIQLYGNNEYSEFLNGILIGKTNTIDEKIKKDFRNSNISHILAISGLHISYVVLFINTFINKMVKSKKKKNIIIIIILILFIFLTGTSASCIRSCIMLVLTLLSSIFYRKNNFYINFFISFIIIIFINPFNIYNIGMWLSFFGTFGIVEFYRFLLRICEICVRKLKFKKIYLNILKIFLISVSAQILIFPIIIYNFNIISINFFISNFLASFVVAPTLCLGYISLFFSYFKFPFTNIVVFFEKKSILLLLKIADVCSKIPGSKIYITTPSIIFLILYYNIFFLFMYLFKKRKFYYFKFIFSFNFFKREFINKIKIIKVLVLIIIIIFINLINNKLNSNLKINFIDVGQGDCTIIQTPKGNNIIIDGGEGDSEKYDYGENVVFPYLLDRKINKIDYLIVSHCDNDHIGGLFYILTNMKVENIIIGKQFESSNNLKKLLELVKINEININVVERGDKILIEDNIFLYVLWPDENSFIPENTVNNNSLVFKFIYKEFSILFTGDIEEIAEQKMIEMYKNEILLNSTILKVAHHRF